MHPKYSRAVRVPPTFEVTEAPHPYSLHIHRMNTAYTHTGAPEAEASPPITAEPTKPLPTLVFFIGGCTFAELAAVRWLGRHESPPREYIVATTHMCNGDDIVQSLVTSLENNLKRL